MLVAVLVTYWVAPKPETVAAAASNTVSLDLVFVDVTDDSIQPYFTTKFHIKDNMAIVDAHFK